jgi:hypothetical protein
LSAISSSIRCCSSQIRRSSSGIEVVIVPPVDAAHLSGANPLLSEPLSRQERTIRVALSQFWIDWNMAAVNFHWGRLVVEKASQ